MPPSGHEVPSYAGNIRLQSKVLCGSRPHLRVHRYTFERILVAQNLLRVLFILFSYQSSASFVYHVQLQPGISLPSPTLS